ncbi:hypothetical protein KAR10_07345 [bacterium]|nr:hypothetical protein [bacterium]
MAVNIRKLAEADLSKTLERDFGLPVILIDPDGNEITENLDETTLKGQTLYSITRIDPETGESIVVNNPVVTLRRSSLARVPVPGEKWLVRIPIDPTDGAEVIDFIIDPDRSPEGGRDIGFIRLYLRRTSQEQ